MLRTRLAALALPLAAACACGRAEAPAPPAPAAEARAPRPAPEAPGPAFGVLPLPEDPAHFRSEYSVVLLDDEDGVRSLSFVRDSGQVVLETRVDLAEPERLLVPYTRWMFVHFLLDPDPETVLLVGLGGGAMVRFLEHYDPEVAIDAIDIDPLIVRLADEYFGVRSRGRTRIAVADAFHWIGAGRERYDAIYMDAFLKPSGDTDPTGTPLRLKTRAFLQTLAEELRPGGAAVFNINVYEEAPEDIAAVEDAFPRSYVFRVPESGNVVVMGSTAEALVPREELVAAGRRLDERSDAGFSFEELARTLVHAR